MNMWFPACVKTISRRSKKFENYYSNNQIGTFYQTLFAFLKKTFERLVVKNNDGSVVLHKRNDSKQKPQ